MGETVFPVGCAVEEGATAKIQMFQLTHLGHALNQFLEGAFRKLTLSQAMLRNGDDPADGPQILRLGTLRRLWFCILRISRFSQLFTRAS